MCSGGKSSLPGWFAVALLCAWAGMASSVQAQRGANLDAVRIETVRIADGFYVLVGEGGNILVSVGDDGILLVDAQYAPLHQKILDALRKISQQPIRFLINTHDHLDHTGGNELMAKAGATIVAHENVRKRLSDGQQAAGGAQGTAPASKQALPTVTYSDSMTLHFNADEVQIFHVDAAHTDGDSVVYFRRANLMHVGDLPSSIRYPRIGAGGSVDGMISAAEWIVQTGNPNTKIIPGHIGTAVGVQEVQQQRDMFVTVRDRIRGDIRAGKTLEQVIASKPTAEFDESRKGSLAPEAFVTLLYQFLSKGTP